MKFKNMIERICYNTSQNNDIKEMLDSIIHTIDHTGENILFHTTKYSEISHLVEKGANVNIINSSGENILFQHVREKNNEIIKYLIDKGSSYNIKNNVGDNLLSISCRFSNDEMIDFFTQKGLTLDSEQSKSVFYKIAENLSRFTKVLQKIYKHLDFSFYSEPYKEYDNILLFLLSKQNTLYLKDNSTSIFEESFIQKLIKEHLNKTYTHENNLLLLSAKYLKFSDFCYIYNLYDFKDYTNDNGENILFVATSYNNIDILSGLIESKDITHIDKHQKNIHGNNIIQHMLNEEINIKYPNIFSLYQNTFS